MSSHIIPKEHRIRKNKIAFEKSKTILINDLYDGKSITKRFINNLDKKALAKAKKKLDRKLLKERAFIIFVIIPTAMFGVKLFLDYIYQALG